MIYAQPQPEPQNKPRKSTWMDTAQLVVSILVFMFFLGGAALCFISLTQSQTNAAMRGFVPSIWAIAFGFLILAGIALVSILSSRQVYYERAPKPIGSNRGAWINGIIIFVPLLILAGYFVMKAKNAPAFLLPLISVLALAVAMLWILKLGQGDKWAQNTKRDSGLFTFSMSFGTLFIMILQLVMLVLLILVVILIFSQQPSILNALEKINLNLQNPELLIEQLSTSAVGPIIAIGILVLVSLIAPLSEELFKTLGVWFLKGRNLSLSDGWIAGLMAGAGFGLIEGILFSMQGVLVDSFGEWLFVILGRIGGLLLHTTLGGIIGYALSKSWLEKRPGPAIGGYLVAMLIHGTWNFVATSQVTLAALFKFSLPDIAVYITLAVLMIAMLITFIGMRRKIWREEMAFSQAFDDYIVKMLEDEVMLIQQGK